MGFDFIMLVLVAYKAFEHYRCLPDKYWRGARLMTVIGRDSLVYFLWYVSFIVLRLVESDALALGQSTFSVFLVTTLLWNLAPIDLFQLATSYSVVVPPAVGARLLLNIRRVFRDDAGSEGASQIWGAENELVETLEFCSHRVEGPDVTRSAGYTSDHYAAE